MRKTVFLAIIINTLTARGDTLSYPDSKPGKTVDTLHDIKVPDPYRWLEDLNSDQTSAWVKAQNSLTDSYLDAIPGRQALENHLTKLWNVERLGVPSFEGGSYFFSKNNGLQNQSVLYSSKSLDLEPTVLLDPNKLSKDGTVALNSYEVSQDGKYLAYSTSASGSDWVEWKVREIPSRKDLSDHLKWSKFSGVSWAKNSKGFYYGRFPTPKDGEEMMAQNIHKKIYFHEIGKPQSEDLLVYERPNQPKQGLYAWVTEDGKYLLIQVSKGTDTKNGLFYKDLSNYTSKVIELLSSFDASYDFITNLGSKFIIRTDLNAPKQKVISIDVNEPLSVRWETIIPESTETLLSVSHIGGLFIANYLKDARTEIRRFKTDGNSLPPVKLPGLGTASGFEWKSDQN